MSWRIALFGDSNFYRLDRVLDDVAHGLTDKAHVATDDYRMSGEDRLEGNVRMGGALQEHGLAHNIDQVLRFDHRCRHSCERGELIDHAADIADMSDDRIGAHREGLRVVLDLLEVSAAQPLGGQLYRGQRVFDFMRDPTGDIRPSRLALS